jgi:hypothetical protein
MRAGLWYRTRGFVDRHTQKIWLLIVVGGVVVALYGVRWEADERAQAIDATSATARAQTCDGLRNDQRLDRLLIDTVLEQPEGAGGSLLDLPSYRALPTEVQTYLRELALSMQPSPDATSLAERLEAFRDEHLGADDLPAYCQRS